MFKFLCLLLMTTTYTIAEETPAQIADAVDSPDNATVLLGEKKLSELALLLLEHYKQPDPVGFPGAPIPDPMSVPNMKHSFSVGRMQMMNVTLHGLKKFKLKHVYVDVNALQVEAGLVIDVLHVIGNYTLSTWFSSAKGPFTVNLTKVDIVAKARLEVERSGSLEAQEIDMDIGFKDISMDFRGLGFFAGMFQGVMNSVGSFVFDSIKPFLLSEANKKIRNDVNKEVKKLPMTFPNSISPLDGLVCEVRKKVRSAGFDPYNVPDYNNTVSVFDIYLTNTWLYGISSFHRTKDISIEIKNRTVNFLIEIGTGRLKGTSNWEISFLAGLMSREGTVTFSIDYIKVGINASQSMDTSLPPSLDDIQVELGNIQIRFDGLNTIDYVVEFGINVLPNLLRYQIMDALEKPIKLKIQEALNQVNVERIVRENADKLDNLNSLDDLKLL